MGCGASQPVDDVIGVGSVLPGQAIPSKVSIASKPLKALKPNKRQSTLTASPSASAIESAPTDDKDKKRKKHSVLPATSLPSSPPPPTQSSTAAAPTAHSPPSPRDDKSRDITPRHVQSASTPTHARSLQPSAATTANQRASSSQSQVAIESIPESTSPAAGGANPSDRPRSGSNVLPPLKMKGRSAAALPVAAVTDDQTLTEPIGGKKKKSKRSNDEPGTPNSGSVVSSIAEEDKTTERTPKARVTRSASSANLSLKGQPVSKALMRQSVVLAPLPPRSKTAQPQPVNPQQQAHRGSMMPAPSTSSSTKSSISASSNSTTSASSAAAAAASSPYFLSPDHQKQLDTYPSLWSSPTLLAAYPEAVFNHYAVISHLPPMHSELMFVSKKGLARLGKDSVDEWMRVWRDRLTSAGSAAAAGGSEAGSNAKEKKRAKGKMDTDGLLVLSKLLQMGKTSKKDVFRDDIDQWVVRRIRQELQADSEGRVSKASFINGWKACHKGIFNTATDEQGKPSDENPLACTIM